MKKENAFLVPAQTITMSLSCLANCFATKSQFNIDSNKGLTGIPGLDEELKKQFEKDKRA